MTPRCNTPSSPSPRGLRTTGDAARRDVPSAASGAAAQGVDWTLTGGEAKKADVKKLPAYAGAVVDGGYTLYRIDKVDVPAQINVEQRKGLQREYGAIVAQQDLAAYLTALRQRYKIDINKSALETRER